MSGSITFVGAGPGAADLITIRGKRKLEEADVVIYAGATVLGRVTIGRGSTIGGNVWLTRSVAPGSHVTQAHSTQEAADFAPSSAAFAQQP